MTKTNPPSNPSNLSNVSRINKPVLFSAVAFLVAIIAIGAFFLLDDKNSDDVTSLKVQEALEYDSFTSSEKQPSAFLKAMAEDSVSVEKGETEVTVYNSNLALVKEGRELELKQGVNQVKYQDVPSLIDPTSVIFTDLKDPSSHVLEQAYQYDLVSQETSS